MWSRYWALLLQGMKTGEPWLVGSEEGTLEHVENNVCEECAGKGVGDHVSDWVFKKEGS